MPPHSKGQAIQPFVPGYLGGGSLQRDWYRRPVDALLIALLTIAARRSPFVCLSDCLSVGLHTAHRFL